MYNEICSTQNKEYGIERWEIATEDTTEEEFTFSNYCKQENQKYL